MKGSYQILGSFVNNSITLVLCIVMIFFGFQNIYSKNEKLRNKKRGIFLIIAGFILLIYHLIEIIIYFTNAK